MDTSKFPKPSGFHLQAVNMAIAILAGVVSIVGGVYSLKANLFQQTGYGDLLGFVQDEKLQAPLWKATVEISDASGSVISTLTTDENGRYFLKDLKEATYSVKAQAVNHLPKVKMVNIQKNKASTIYFDLTPAPAPAPDVPYPSEVPGYVSPGPPIQGETQAPATPSVQDTLVQAGTTLLQDWVQKKTGSTTSTTSTRRTKSSRSA